MYQPSRPPLVQRRPNVIFILTDDQGYGELACNGNSQIKTPNIDALHAESVRFTDFHVGTTCAPTRSGLLTGHYANSTGVWHTIGGRSLLREDEWTLPQALRQGGYRTAHFGKWHLGDAAPLRPFERGFDLSIYHGGGGVGNTPDNWGNDYFDDTYFVNGKPKKFKGYCTDVFFAAALDFIASDGSALGEIGEVDGTVEGLALGEIDGVVEGFKDGAAEGLTEGSTLGDDDEKPFFCYIATNAPHHPFNVENKYADLYRGSAPTEDQARFYGMVTNIDENVGKLRSKLGEMGLSQNTVVVYMSDNGSGGGVSNYDENGHVTEGPCNYNAGMRGIKGWEYEGGHRVPFMIRCPPAVLCDHLAPSYRSVGVGRDIAELTTYVDFMPTVLDLTNTAIPKGRTFHGVSLGPLIRGWEQPELQGRIVITDTQRVARPVKWYHSCVMKNKWRLINGKELYNIESDPGQRTDIAAKNPDLIPELRSAYEKWWTIVSKQFDLDVPYAVGGSGDTVTLTSHDLRNDAGDVAWHQMHVRAAKVVSGYWALDVRAAGPYEIVLRRWPQSTGYKLSEAIDGDDSGWRQDCIQRENAAMYQDGVALRIRWAHIEIAGESLYEEIEPDAESVTFTVDLPMGETKLFAGLYDKGAPQTIAPYYVYITKLQVR